MKALDDADCEGGDTGCPMPATGAALSPNSQVKNSRVFHNISLCLSSCVLFWIEIQIKPVKISAEL